MLKNIESKNIDLLFSYTVPITTKAIRLGQLIKMSHHRHLFIKTRQTAVLWNLAGYKAYVLHPPPPSLMPCSLHEMTSRW